MTALARPTCFALPYQNNLLTSLNNPLTKAHLFALPVDECGRVGDQARIELPPRLVRRKMLVEEALRPIRVGSKAQAV